MSRIISVTCQNTLHCNHVNVFPENELVGEVPLADASGNRLDPPPVEIDEQTFVKCEKCGYPISCVDATISDEDDHA